MYEINKIPQNQFERNTFFSAPHLLLNCKLLNCCIYCVKQSSTLVR